MLRFAAPSADEITAVCGSADEVNRLCSTLYRLTDNPGLAEGSLFLVTPARILLIVVLALIATRTVRVLIRRFTLRMRGELSEGGALFNRRHRKRASSDVLDTAQIATLRAAQRAETIGTLLRSVATLLIWTIAVFMLLSELGLDVGPLIAGAGIIGIALGFGAQNLVRDFLSGIFMLIEDQFGVGDIIDAGPASGTVEAVTLRTTRLRDVRGVVWHIPNGTVERIGNQSQGWSRALLDISVGYTTDLDMAQDVIQRTATTLWREDPWSLEILDEPEVWGVEDFGPDGILIRVVIKTRPASQWKVSRELRARVKNAFDEAGIEIPFPQRVVWHREEEASRRHEPAPASDRRRRRGRPADA